MGIILSIVYFVLVLGILVFVHEFGHFLMARLSGMRVEVFSLGMGFRLLGWNKTTGFTFGNLPKDLELGEHTDYRIAAFPIGGYCKISGMVDETFDTEFQGQAPQKWEFRAKNPFKKAITISGGVLFNILLAIFLFSIIIFDVGETAYKTTTIGTVQNHSIGSIIGLQPNDEIIDINKQKPENWTELVKLLALDNLGQNLNITVKRNNETMNIFVDGKKQVDNIASSIPLGIEPIGMRTVVLDVLKGDLADKNGILANDTIISVNNQSVTSTTDFVTKLKQFKNQNVTLEIKNKSGISEKSFKLSEAGTIGVHIATGFTGEVLKINYNVFESVWEGTKQTFENFGMIISSIKQIVVGNLEFKKAIGGPVMIAQQATQFAERGLYSFMSFTAMLSISLALINILPFPALDGGHLLIIIIEAIIKREIPVKAKLIAQQIGMFLLLALMAYVIFNDVQKIL